MTNVDLNVLLKEIENCCEGLNICEVCEKEECLMGYMKAIIHESINSSHSKITDSIYIPRDDVKIYKKDHINNILELIKKLGKETDYKFSVMRSCCEIALVRREREYAFELD